MSTTPRLVQRVRTIPAWLQDLMLATIVSQADLVAAYLGPAGDGALGLMPAWVRAVAVLPISAPLILRRRRPTLVMVMTGVGAVIILALGAPIQPLAPLVALYSVAAWDSLRRAVVATSIFLAVVVIGSVVTAQLVLLYTNVLAVAGAAVLGRLIRAYREQAAELKSRARQLEESRAAEQRLAVRAERSRIAREMHDVLAHSTSVMVVQATGARRIVHKDPSAAAEALAAIEQTGRSTLVDIRQMLGMLRGDDDAAGEPGTSPQPGLADLDDLVAEMREAGLPVVLRTGRAPLHDIDVSIGLSTYRIVQEALTNALKHADADRVTVEVRRLDRRLEVEVLDDGGRDRRDPTDLQRDLPAPDPGYGLLGMRERAALCGGHIEAGPRRGGGFRVAVTFPLRGATATAEVAP